MTAKELEPIVADLLRVIHLQDRAVLLAIDRDDENYATMSAKLDGLKQALNIVLKHKTST